MQFYFIRHAESENNRLWTETGSSVGRHEDPPITAVGHQQAETLAQFLAQPYQEIAANSLDYYNQHGFGLTHLYCSLMTRAIQTGVYVAEACQIPLMGLTKPHEVGGLYWYDEESGEAMGQTGPNRAHFEEHYPALLLPEEVGETGWWNERIEHRDAVIERAEEVLASLLEKHKGTDDRVGLVSHGGFYQRFMTAVFHLDAQHLHETSPHRYRFAINNCAITRFEFGEDFTGLVYQNRVDFLLPSLITV